MIIDFGLPREWLTTFWRSHTLNFSCSVLPSSTACRVCIPWLRRWWAGPKWAHPTQLCRQWTWSRSDHHPSGFDCECRFRCLRMGWLFWVLRDRLMGWQCTWQWPRPSNILQCTSTCQLTRCLYLLHMGLSILCTVSRTSSR